MRLTDEEQRMLDGEYGKTVQKCMKVLVALGKIYGADHMIEVKSVHSPGVSYRVTGDAGLNTFETNPYLLQRINIPHPTFGLTEFKRRLLKGRIFAQLGIAQHKE